MSVDVLALQRFYGSGLGGLAQRLILRRLQALWPQATGLDMLGVGYAPPYLEPYRDTARRVAAMMPAAQGAERWPGEGGALTALGDETRLPFRDAVFDRALIVHALEETDAARPFLREIWRVMAPEGRLVVVVANRSGLWANSDATPFGYGRPYSRRQLSNLLSESMFEPMAWARAIYAPPLDWGPLVAAGEAMERTGELLWRPFGGVVMVEAVKRLYAGAAPELRRIPLSRAPAGERPAPENPVGDSSG